MTTFRQLVDQVHSMLHSSTGLQEQIAALTTGINASDVTVALSNTSGFSKGITEIDDELIYASSVDATALTLPAFGRGFRGTTAATHSSGAMVTYDPTFPRFDIKQAINQVLEAVYPTLYQIKSTTFTFSGPQAAYPLPTDCDGVVKVIWEAVGPSKYWPTVATWDFETNSEVANGNAISIGEYVMPGRTVKVLYKAKFTQFAADADTFATVGFPESGIDVLLYGAASKLIRFLAPARLQLGSVENLSRSGVGIVTASDAGTVANQLYAMYQQRLQEERRRLLNLNQPQIHFTR